MPLIGSFYLGLILFLFLRFELDVSYWFLAPAALVVAYLLIRDGRDFAASLKDEDVT